MQNLLRGLCLLAISSSVSSFNVPALLSNKASVSSFSHRPSLSAARQECGLRPVVRKGDFVLRGTALTVGPITGKLVLGIDLILGLLYIVRTDVKETQYLAGSVILFMLYLLWSHPALLVIQIRYQLFHNLVGMALFGKNYNRRVIIDNLLNTRTFIINAIFVALYAYFGFV